MGSKTIKVIKAKLPQKNKIKKDEPLTTHNMGIGNEKRIVRKITENINNWVKEHRESKSNIQLPIFAN